MSVRKPPQIPLPKAWNRHVRSAMLHVISLSQYAAVYTRSWAVNSINATVRLKAEKDQMEEELDVTPDAIMVRRRDRQFQHDFRKLI